MSLSFTFLDALVAVIVLVSVVYAALRGFLSETLTIFAWAAAAFACLYFGPYMIPWMRSMVSQAWLASALAYAAVFLGVFVPLAFISRRLGQSVRHSPIGPLDRAAGVAFGVARGLFIVALAYLAFSYFVPTRNHPDWIRNARLLPLVQSSSEILLSMVPDHPAGLAHFLHHGDVRREEPKIEQKAAISPDMPSGASPRHDPVAELIRKNGQADRVFPDTKEPVRHQKTGPKTVKVTKSYGASDRQALDKLVESGGNGK